MQVYSDCSTCRVFAKPSMQTHSRVYAHRQMHSHTNACACGLVFVVVYNQMILLWIQIKQDKNE